MSNTPVKTPSYALPGFLTLGTKVLITNATPEDTQHPTRNSLLHFSALESIAKARREEGLSNQASPYNSRTGVSGKVGKAEIDFSLARGCAGNVQC